MSEISNLDRKDLKVQALLERITAQENQIADLRVEVTVLQDQLQELISNAQSQPQEAPIMPMHASDIVQGEVVDVPQAQSNHTH